MRRSAPVELATSRNRFLNRAEASGRRTGALFPEKRPTSRVRILPRGTSSGAGNGGLGRSRMDRRFPPWGVKSMASYGCTLYKAGSDHLKGSPLRQPQRFTLRGRSPRCCGPGRSRKAASVAERQAFSASVATRRNEAAPRGYPPSRRVGAPHERGAGGGSDPPVFAAGAASGGGNVLTPASTITPALRGVAPSTVIPAGRLLAP